MRSWGRKTFLEGWSGSLCQMLLRDQARWTENRWSLELAPRGHGRSHLGAVFSWVRRAVRLGRVEKRKGVRTWTWWIELSCPRSVAVKGSGERCGTCRLCRVNGEFFVRGKDTGAVCTMRGLIQQRGRNSGCRTHSASIGGVRGLWWRLHVGTLSLAGAEVLQPSYSGEGRGEGPKGRCGLSYGGREGRAWPELLLFSQGILRPAIYWDESGEKVSGWACVLGLWREEKWNSAGHFGEWGLRQRAAEKWLRWRADWRAHMRSVVINFKWDLSACSGVSL